MLRPHQLTLEVLAERGTIGGVLLAFSLSAIAVAGTRARRRASESQHPQVLIAGLFGVCAYRLVHTQLDWMWQMGALTVPAMLAAGCLLDAPWRAVEKRQIGKIEGIVIVTLLLALGIVAAPSVVAHWHVGRPHVELLTGDEEQALHHAAVAARAAPHWSRSWQAVADAHVALDQPETAASGHASVACTASRLQRPPRG